MQSLLFKILRKIIKIDIMDMIVNGTQNFVNPEILTQMIDFTF